jgi:hypothetical protein
LFGLWGQFVRDLKESYWEWINHARGKQWYDHFLTNHDLLVEGKGRNGTLIFVFVFLSFALWWQT